MKTNIYIKLKTKTNCQLISSNDHFAAISNHKKIYFSSKSKTYTKQNYVHCHNNNPCAIKLYGKSRERERVKRATKNGREEKTNIDTFASC